MLYGSASVDPSHALVEVVTGHEGRGLVLMVVDDCFQGQESAETLGGRPWLLLGAPGPGEVHLREGAVADGEDHVVTPRAFHYGGQVLAGELVLGADLGPGFCRESGS